MLSVDVQIAISGRRILLFIDWYRVGQERTMMAVKGFTRALNDTGKYRYKARLQNSLSFQNTIQALDRLQSLSRILSLSVQV